MSQFTSPASTPAGMPVVNQAHIGKQAGAHLHFPTFAAFTAAITPGVTGYSANLWAVGQSMSIATEGGAIRRWNGTHARNVTMPDGTPVLLANDTATATAPIGGSPVTGCTYVNGNLTGYTQNGITYTITYTTAGGFTVPATRVGGGRTITYAYNGQGQLTGETIS